MRGIRFILKALRKVYSKTFGKTLKRPGCDTNPESAAATIYNALTSDKPIMIARFGSTEMICLRNYQSIKNGRHKYFSYIQGKTQPWWWEDGIVNQMQNWSGFFPPEEKKLEQFGELMLQDIPLVDVLGSWLPEENYFDKELAGVPKIDLELLNPFFSKNPWTRALEAKKVLVVHPFANTIQRQYKRRSLLFENDLLPEFDLKTIKAVQSIAGEKTPFADWFEALDHMKKQIDATDYDICLLGCGAYGFPLAAHIKRMGKKGFHLGGSLQLLFGIRGARWEDENYNDVYNYAQFMNEYWVKPNEDETPTNANSVEGACYW
jgi:hypothetical protein